MCLRFCNSFGESARSELELERELPGARPANLVERVEAAVGAARPQAARQRLRRAAEKRTAQRVGGVAEVRVVEDVEELRAEAKPHLFDDAKLSLQPDVRLPGPETPQHVAPEITLPPGGRRNKSRAAENFAAGILPTEKLKRHPRLHVRPGVEPDSRSGERETHKIDGR